ncbi:coproporphyrinogen III oxidase [Piscirickettsia salmonis]|uniref:Heme chaperone HemW n=1 Tax=Piscirickettsia salmonis TaxID=1238 RepID=A0A9Q6LGU2_PISSA|nr:radical SAM family heme chaperone HemW [Piscirickettsia salmonis]ALA26464.1 radical SAM superfamily protein [Piscirickettsia salmonis]APS43885.1 coproporphyrinogen III oxidase [Piscirickettsia salmonis]APS47239.1 coproporphyrinogen III oxidase [Piscirickettsia salmonis]APS51323.1 coproporphyrinogen III oxidase [Piscirickettsia salmonis]APS54531.1 coproporphyrinogen III oxidase [Piscirickettsia salmonis]
MLITALPPLSLYIHIPWCIKKCPYCDFNSHPMRGDLPEAEYIQRLITDLKLELENLSNSNPNNTRALSSIFIGGGTPSLFSPNSIYDLLTQIQSLIPFKNDMEITLEANPSTFEYQRFIDYNHAGINRLSIGIQSFNNSQLKNLGRVHDSKDAFAAIDIAHQSGFNSFNIDIMYGLPKQTHNQALADLKQAIALKPPHLSWYQLTLEPNTLFHAQPPKLPDDESIWQMQLTGQELLKKQGLHQYEISAYSQDQHQAKHNTNYWQFGDYLGIGAGAHGKITSIKQNNITRRWKLKHPKAYLDSKQNLLAGSQIIKPEDLPFEFMMNALRLTTGVPTGYFSARTGLAFSTIQPKLTQLQTQDLLSANPDTICTSFKGRQFLNSLLEKFI